jgi:hypothetical protein
MTIPRSLIFSPPAGCRHTPKVPGKRSAGANFTLYRFWPILTLMTVAASAFWYFCQWRCDALHIHH